MQHEAGHFLIAYLVGILPKGYTLSSLEALKKEGSLNVQAGTAFVDLEFLEEVGCFLQSDYFLLSPFFFMTHCCCFASDCYHLPCHTGQCKKIISYSMSQTSVYCCL